jgi:primase-polymerase (primpol)-like protein
MTLRMDVVPAELRDRAQWLVWRFEPNPKKLGGNR